MAILQVPFSLFSNRTSRRCCGALKKSQFTLCLARVSTKELQENKPTFNFPQNYIRIYELLMFGNRYNRFDSGSDTGACFNQARRILLVLPHTQ